MDKIIIINWKINVNYAQMNEFIERLDGTISKSLIILPSYVGLFIFSTINQNKILPNQLGFQYVNSFARGDYTGDISYLEAKEVGVDYILVNHHEALEYRKWDKTYDVQNHKIKKLIENGMIPIVCIGNDIKDSFDDFDKIVINEVSRLFNEVKFLEDSKFIFNYMPYFVVKNSIILSNNEIERQINMIKAVLLEFFGEYVYKNCLEIIYGGKLFDQISIPDNIDGVYIDNGNDFNYVNNLLSILKNDEESKEKAKENALVDSEKDVDTNPEDLDAKEMDLRTKAIKNIDDHQVNDSALTDNSIHEDDEQQ